MTYKAHSGVLCSALAGNSKRQVFAPYLWKVAAEREGRALEQIPSASALVMALTNVRQLVESDVIHVPIEDASSIAMEALRRLSGMPREFDLAAVVSGPVALGQIRSLQNRDDCMDDFEDLARSVLDAGCDVLMVREPNPDPETASSFGAMAKLASFFGGQTLVLAPVSAAFAINEGFNGLDTGGAGPAPVGVPVAMASSDSPLPTASIVTSSWSALPGAADVDWLRRIARQIRNDGKE